MINRHHSFGALLRAYRRAAGLSQVELAALAQMGDRQIRNLENGSARSPHRTNVRLLVDALQLPADAKANLLRAARPVANTPPVAPTAGLLANPTAPVPAPVPLIGRDRDLTHIRMLVSDPTKRLLTLTGPGGVGKTALAVCVAQSMSTCFADGQAMVSLETIRDASLVPSAIAAVLRLAAAPRCTIEQALVDALRDLRFLLVLDNFEHVLSAAPLVSMLLHSCPHLHLLVTSRANLQLRGGYDVPIAPLDTPRRDHRSQLDSIGRVPAVELFVDRARAVQPDFSLTVQNAEDVAEVCRRLDGLPLAIELAAARVKLLPPAQLVKRLDGTMSALGRGVCDLPPRQQTLHDAIAWSYDLLDAREQTLLQWLTVFESGYTPEAAEAVCGIAPDGQPDVAVLDGIASLVNKSLIGANDGRLTMLQTIREFAATHFARSRNAANVRRRHVTYYRDLAEQTCAPNDTDEVHTRERLEIEHNNLRTALRYAVELGDAENGLRIAQALSQLWFSRGSLSEGAQWMGKLIQQVEQLDRPISPVLHVDALNLAGRIAMDMGEYERAKRLRERCVAVARDLADPPLLAETLSGLAGAVLYCDGDFERAARLSDDALALRRAAGDKVGQVRSLRNLANMAGAMGDHERAMALMAECAAISREIGDARYVGRMLLDHADLSCDQGRLDEAADRYTEGLPLVAQVEDHVFVAYGLAGFGRVARYRKDFPRSDRYYNDALTVARKHGDKNVLAWVLEGFAALARLQGDATHAVALYREYFTTYPQLTPYYLHARTVEGLAHLCYALGDDIRAARMYGAARGLRAALKTPPPPVDLATLQNLNADLERRLGGDRLLDTLQEGTDLSLAQIGTEAIHTCDLIQQLCAETNTSTSPQTHVYAYN